MMNLPLFIAGRYLFAKKSHNVINIISAISSIGMAIGTAALVIILSIYNGFDGLIKSNLSDVEPDILITPAKGKVFIPEGEAFASLQDDPRITQVCHVLQESVFVDYEGHQGIAKAKGVDTEYELSSPLAEHIVRGTFSLHKGDLPQCVAGTGLAYRLGMNPDFLASARIYFPARDKAFSVSNPMASVRSVRARPSGIFSVTQQIDNELIVLPLDQMRELLACSEEVSGIELRVADSRQTKKVIRDLRKSLGEDYEVLDRYRQNTSLYKMMMYEKAAIFIILLFIIIIIAFNVFGSLTMLIIEKGGDIETLYSLGAETRLVRKIFTLEGWLISLLGLAAGLVLGIAFSLVQQHFGIIRMQGNFLVSAYPVMLRWSDILITAIGVALVGYLIALIPVRRNIISDVRE